MENKPPAGPSKGYQKQIKKEDKPRPKPIMRSTDYSSPLAKKWPQFIEAIQNGNLDVINGLIEEGINVNTLRDDLTPLMIAVSKGKVETAELLLQSGANINEKNSEGWTALHKAAYEQAGAEVVQFLMESGIDINAKNRSRKTALDLAEEKNHRVVVNSIKTRLAKLRVDAEEWNAFLNTPEGKPYKQEKRLESLAMVFKLWWLPVAVLGAGGVLIGMVTHAVIPGSAIGLGLGAIISTFLFLWDKSIRAYLSKIGPLPHLDIEMVRQKRKAGEPILIPRNAQDADSATVEQPETAEPGSGPVEQSTVILSPQEETRRLPKTAHGGKMKWILAGVVLLVLMFLLGAAIGARDMLTKWYYTKKLEHRGVGFSEQAFLNASATNNEELVELFLKAGVKLNVKNEQGQTAFMLAAQQGHAKLLAKLLAHPAPHFLNETDKNGNTALMIAATRGRPEIVAKLVEGGAKVAFTVPGKEGPASALQTVLDTVPFKEEHLKILQYLLERGASPRDKNSTGGFPLLFAADRGLVQAGRLLLEKGADVNESDFTGRFALMAAACKGHGDFVELLAEKGAYLQMALPDGFTPLMCAAREGKVEAIRKLIARGAPVNAKTSKGHTALTEATRIGDVPCAQALLEHGAEPESAHVPDGFLALNGKIVSYSAKKLKLSDAIKRIASAAAKDGYTILIASGADRKINFSMKAPWNKLLQEMAKKHHFLFVLKEKQIALIAYPESQRSIKIN